MSHGLPAAPLAGTPAPARTARRVTSPRPTSVLVAVVSVFIAALVAWASWTANSNSNLRLLSLQVRQTASVLGNQVPVISAQLLDAAQVAEATQADPQIFRRFVAPKVSATGPFASISLWRIDGGQRTLLAREGVEPLLPTDPSAESFFAKVKPSRQTYVTRVMPGPPARFGYAVRAAGDTAGLVVYAERFLPPDRRVTVPPTSPFAGLRLAVYLGRETTGSQLLESTAPVPIEGRTRTEVVPFGDTVLTVVGSTPQQLAGGLSAALPWIVLVVGCVVAVSSAATVEYVSRRRAVAESLARENARLYQEQRTIAGTLQHALLPEVPDLTDLQVAARYVPGVAGTEVGGDWYDVINPEPGRCVFVVGDVSGRGLRAATTMASLRFAIRAYVTQGDSIDTVLVKLGDLLQFDTHRQFATVLIGEIDTQRGRVSLVSAGHFAPLLVTEGRAEFLNCGVEPPIGVSPAGRPTPASFTIDGEATLLAFTDGLVERHREVIDAGLDRLREASREMGGRPLDDLLDGLAAALIPDGTEDDTVILGLRWTT